MTWYVIVDENGNLRILIQNTEPELNDETGEKVLLRSANTSEWLQPEYLKSVTEEPLRSFIASIILAVQGDEKSGW